MINLTPVGSQAALALITDLYSQVVNLTGQLDQERQQYAEDLDRLQRQLDALRAAVRAEAGVPTDT